MTLDPNTLISHYKILAPVGKGGMGEVYRALDQRLDREVAIKMLPDEFAQDKDRLRRFELEARSTSALNHPNILTVYDIGEFEGTPYIVSELLEGEELRDSIEEGTVTLGKALDYAQQIAEGLSAAHGKGIVHRDLKPENIFVTNDYRVKILDFGLAKLTPKLVSESESEDTTRKAITDPGTVMGTAGYMSPEQIRGGTIDHRSDIFSFGSILYEMLAGRRAFRKETIAETMTAILKEEPEDLRSANPGVDPALTRIVNRCLEKRPDLRFQTTTDLGFALGTLANSLSTSSGPVQTATGSSSRPGNGNIWTAAWFWPGVEIVGLIVLIAVLGGISYLGADNGGNAPVVRFDVPPPKDTYDNIRDLPSVALSPDGSTLVFVAVENGASYLFVRRRDDAAATKLEGTKNASYPAFSPDGKSIAFQADGQLNRLTFGEPVSPVVEVQSAASISWRDNNTIIYTPKVKASLMEIQKSGGKPKELTTLDAAKNERTHRYAQTLPGGKAMIFTVGVQDSPDDYENATIDGFFFDSGKRKQILKGASMARYSPPGNLIFSRGGVLYAVKFDPESLTTSGDPVAVVEGVAGDRLTGAAQFSIADDGTLAYIPGDVGMNLIPLVPVWKDLNGATEKIDVPNGYYNDIRLSPDGKKLVYILGNSGRGDVWVYDFDRKTSTRLTFDGSNATPIWSPDGRDVLYDRLDQVKFTSSIFRTPIDGSRQPEKLVDLEHISYLKAVEKNGQFAFIDYMPYLPPTDVARIELRPGAKPELLMKTPFKEYVTSLSSDGRRVAYQSNESGREEIYVKELSGEGGRWQISSSGGYEPVWSKDGKKLFFRDDVEMFEVDVTTDPGFNAGTPKELFRIPYAVRPLTGMTYDVAPDGTRLIILDRADDTSNKVVRVVMNWTAELEKKMAK